ncbi:SUR7/PalI family-domain-containing protein [Leptodontidium sp. 2 PMI_412]|nr:SUR7/PalI family-domain-containing protein [Leptodontidium sp. MPI-SDFR-AT-0119]KAH9223497.1 SUR7/PalI family-domain-containing protein [Leptodontidium sp. 2 PMI_412]
MPLPTFRSLAARRQSEKRVQENGVTGPEQNSERTLTPTYTPGVDVKKATKTRKIWIIISCVCFFISIIFLILTIIGNTSDKPVLRDTYFYSLDLANIIPSSADNIMLVNSLARSLGLHDFYQVGLWNFCEGYNGEGITYCSTPQTLYWFNPVEILLNELLAGATIALPAEVTDILNLIKIASRVMFGFYLTGICMNFLSIFIAPIALKSRWWSFPLTIWTFIAALLTTAATIIATVMAVIFRNTLTSQPDLNISASIGRQMFGFMWTGSAFSILGFLIHLCMSCCCASRRDVRTGRRKGRLSAYGDAGSDEKKRPFNQRQWTKMPKFMRRRKSGEVV